VSKPRSGRQLMRDSIRTEAAKLRQSKYYGHMSRLDRYGYLVKALCYRCGIKRGELLELTADTPPLSGGVR
jgi:hypothetical protein